MDAFKNFLKTTVVGGILFLVPLIVLLIVFRHAFGLVGKLVHPLVERFPQHQIAGVTFGSFAAISVLVLLCFLAGMVARTGAGRGITSWFEKSLLGGLPQYQMVKSMATGLAKLESADGLRSALISIEEGWQLGYVLETLENGWVVVFLPQSPTPMSGNMMYLPPERVRLLEMPVSDTVLLVKRLGLGSREALAGVDMRM